MNSNSGLPRYLTKTFLLNIDDDFQQKLGQSYIINEFVLNFNVL